MIGEKTLPKILIIDDEPVNIKVLSQILKTDYLVSFAINGRDAIALIDSGIKPDIILLDIMMPEMNGYEVCSRIKEKPETADIPIIFISAIAVNEEIQKGLSLGAVDYIQKPFHPDSLKEQIKSHLKLEI